MIFKQLKAIDYYWAIWRQDETIDELLNIFPDRGAIYLEQLEKFTSESRKKEWLAVRALLFKMLDRQLHISYLPDGKPYFSGNEGYISITHTKGYVAVIYSKTRAVGIDIERIGDRIHRVAHKFVAEGEMPVYNLKQLSETEILTMIWSAKEVMFKCMNKSDVDFREHLFVDISNAFVCQPYSNAYETRSEDRQHFSISYMIQPGEFVMAWTII